MGKEGSQAGTCHLTTDGSYIGSGCKMELYPGVVVHLCNIRISKLEARGFVVSLRPNLVYTMSSKTTWTIQEVLGQPHLHSEF